MGLGDPGCVSVGCWRGYKLPMDVKMGECIHVQEYVVCTEGGACAVSGGMGCHGGSLFYVIPSVGCRAGVLG